MTRPVAITWEVRGPFFQGDAGRKFRENIQAWLEQIAEEGEDVVRAALSAGSGSRATIRRIPGDRVAEHVHGRVRSLTGKHWLANAVISVNNSGLSAPAGISLMAAASNLEGRLHAFRRTASALRSSIRRANLTKGLE